MAAPEKAIDILNEKLERAKESLHCVDENIRKFTGREFGERSRATEQRRVSVGTGRPGVRNRGARAGPLGTSRLAVSAFERLGAPLAKRPNRGSAFSRLGNRVDAPGPRIGIGRQQRDPDEDFEEDLPHKPALSSSVVAPSSVTRTRKDSIEEQSQDSKGTARNRRMFGLILGTLQKFKSDAGQKSEKEIQRQEIEHKLEVRAKKEKQEIASERRELFTERRNKQKELERLEELMEIAKEQEMWDRHSITLGGYIQTKAKPPLFYRPRKMLQEDNKKLEETKKNLAEMASKRREEIEEEIKSFEGFGKEKDERKNEKENVSERMEDSAKDENDERRKRRRESEKEGDGDKLRDRESRRDRERGRGSDRNRDRKDRERKDKSKDHRNTKEERDRSKDKDRRKDERDRSKETNKRDRSRDNDKKKESRNKSTERKGNDEKKQKEKDDTKEEKLHSEKIEEVEKENESVQDSVEEMKVDEFERTNENEKASENGIDGMKEQIVDVGSSEIPPEREGFEASDIQKNQTEEPLIGSVEAEKQNL